MQNIIILIKIIIYGKIHQKFQSMHSNICSWIQHILFIDQFHKTSKLYAQELSNIHIVSSKNTNQQII